MTANGGYQQLRSHLADLKLTAAAEALPAELDHIRNIDLSHTAFLERLLGIEVEATAVRRHAGTAYIEPGSPWHNPWVESYGSPMRDELLAIEQFDTLLQAQVLVAD